MTATTTTTHVTNLECSLCGREYESGKPHNLCTCGGPLLVRYDLERIRQSWCREDLASAPNSMWRYAPALPVVSSESIVSLGEGMTPLLPARRTGKRIGAADLWIKDEGLNPTGSFKARGMSCAVSMCVELGLKKLAAPSAGNAASALAAYAAAAGLESHIFMPKDVPQANYVECRAYGAQVTLVDGLISDCGRIVAERAPTLRVPKPLGDFLVLEAVRKSGGTAISISDSDLMDAGAKLASDEGIFACPEGAACVAAAERLLRSGFLKADHHMVIYNTGSGLKYLEAHSERFPRPVA